MSSEPHRNSVSLFDLGTSIEGSPVALPPASYVKLGAKEVQDLERWLKAEPRVMGEELLIVASQVSNWDRTRDRPDLLALDRNGKLVVVEIKRDESGSGQDLQALRYAAYASTLDAEQVLDLYRSYRSKEHDEDLDPEQAREQLENFLHTAELDALDDDFKPRIILVAGAYQAGVTGTALWLTQNFDMDIACVQLVPYEVEGRILLSSTVLIPLPEAGDYEVRLKEKRAKSSRSKGKSLDLQAARDFIASIPPGRWASYGDVAAAAGNPLAGQPIGTWLSNKGGDVPNVYRVLNRFGEVSEGWKAATPGLPPGPDDVRGLLATEGVHLDAAGRASKDQRWSVDEWAAENESAE